MANTTGYFFEGSKPDGSIIDASILTPSEVVKRNIVIGEYSCVDSHFTVAALSSSVRSFPPVADQSSTCLGCVVDDHVSMKYWAFGDMLMLCRPAVVVMRFIPLPSNLISHNCRSSGDGLVAVK